MNAPAGHTVLLVEDEIVVAAKIERILKGAGYVVIGPAGSVAEALVQIVQRDIEAAILNIRVGQELTEPVLNVLSFSRVPFILVSSLSHTLVPSKYQNRPFLSWPCLDSEIVEQLALLLTPAAPVDPSARPGRSGRQGPRSERPPRRRRPRGHPPRDGSRRDR